MRHDFIAPIIGNLTKEPTLGFTEGKDAYCNFGIAVNNARKDGDEWVELEPTFINVTCWRGLAEHVAASLSKGDRAFVIGRVQWYEREYQGETYTGLEMTADDCGPSLLWHTAEVTKAEKTGGGGRQQRSNGRSKAKATAAAKAADAPYDEEPF